MQQRKNTNEGIKIRISGLSNGIHEYHLSTEPSVLGLDEKFTHAVKIDARIDKTTRQIYLTTSVSTSGRFQCDRCLDEFTQPVSGAYAVCYVYSETDYRNTPDEEFMVITSDMVYIDLTENIRDTILLSVPLKLLCKESCGGLCSQCGINKNLATCECVQENHDPRRQELQDFVKQRK
jgi:uncharacterized protein